MQKYFVNKINAEMCMKTNDTCRQILLSCLNMQINVIVSISIYEYSDNLTA